MTDENKMRDLFEAVAEQCGPEIPLNDRTETGYDNWEVDQAWLWFRDGWRACEEQSKLKRASET